jgi:hypothetical protein
MDADEATRRASVLKLVRRMGRLTTTWERAVLVAGDDLAGLAGELDGLAAGARALHERFALGPGSRLVLRPGELNPPTD